MESLDDEIEELRVTLKTSSNPQTESPPEKPSSTAITSANKTKGKYNAVDDKDRLERLVRAKEKTKESLEGRAGWAGMDQAKDGGGTAA